MEVSFITLIQLGPTFSNSKEKIFYFYNVVIFLRPDVSINRR